jgi:hypothetical protein
MCSLGNKYEIGQGWGIQKRRLVIFGGNKYEKREGWGIQKRKEKSKWNGMGEGGGL